MDDGMNAEGLQAISQRPSMAPRFCSQEKKVHVSGIRECGNNSLQRSDGTYFYFLDLGVSYIGTPIQHA